ncbi:P-loop containing nucleoside triphosphate hydrolase protein [Mycotypha africana]|uniref:P-loop containing nucleoside triphosphate hydrolase protein n=1 Tax=Mycotypha africana TaxID=64632 RepID=UPI0023019BA9|nr:P-loop containing nucleoside triphosphate hydrolase protein [Mycotypha africana]KAI8984662.1 P-loop containing nucleoside triphosphate hydrolase protein [Mycotypha africana]
MSCFGEEESLKRKIVIVGDGACGKTCLFCVYSKGDFPHSYVPTIFENSVKDTVIDTKQVVVELWDTAGQEDYDRLRTLSYPDADVILVAFSIDAPESLSNVKEKWVPEVRRYCPPDLPVLLVGCKADLRQDKMVIESLQKESLTPVTTLQGLQMAKELGFYKYVECSALLGKGVNEVFYSAIKSTMKQSACIIL